MAAKKSRKVNVNESSGFGLNLGDLLKAKGLEQEDDAAETATPTEDTSSSLPETLDFSQTEKVVLRHERKGRGGRLVTLVTGLQLSDAGLKLFAKEVRRSFGCGATVEGENIALQGDHLERARSYLERKGIKRIILGSRPRK